MVACGGANAGPLGPGGTGGAGGVGGTGGTVGPPMDQSMFRLSCTVDTVQLSIPIELLVELKEQYSNSMATEATFTATVVLEEESVAGLIAATITTIDIVSASVTTTIAGATPATMTSSFGAAPLIDFDLQVDTDDNGMPGPHRLELDPVTATSAAGVDSNEVTFNLDFEGISFLFGDFSIPMNCRNPALVGVAVTFPVHL